METFVKCSNETVIKYMEILYHFDQYINTFHLTILSNPTLVGTSELYIELGPNFHLPMSCFLSYKMISHAVLYGFCQYGFRYVLNFEITQQIRLEILVSMQKPQNVG